MPKTANKWDKLKHKGVIGLGKYYCCQIWVLVEWEGSYYVWKSHKWPHNGISQCQAHTSIDSLWLAPPTLALDREALVGEPAYPYLPPSFNLSLTPVVPKHPSSCFVTDWNQSE